MTAQTISNLTSATDRATALLAVSTAFRISHGKQTLASIPMADDREDGPWFEVFCDGGRRWTIVIVLATHVRIIGPDGAQDDDVRISRSGLRPGDLVEVIEAFARMEPVAELAAGLGMELEAA